MIIKLILITIFYICLSFEQNSDQIDKPEIRYFKNLRIGLQVTIPNKPGLNFFAFHGAINRFIKPNEFGDFHGIVTNSKSNLNAWVYLNKDITLNENDILYYWYHLQINNVKYDSLSEQISANEIGSPRNDGEACKKSHTITMGNRINCSDELIFQETFENLDGTKWKHEIRMPSEDSAFISYQDLEENLFTKDNELTIIPTTPYNITQIKATGMFSLPKCTGSVAAEECSRDTGHFRITPPIVSAKILSNFSFLYGKIEIRAKLPIGDWIIPQLHLEPRDNIYSEADSKEYSSGQMRIAFIRGNQFIKDVHNQSLDLDGRTLYGGAILEHRGLERHFLKQTKQDKHFGEDFHIYTLVWTKEGIQMFMDDIKYGTIEKGLWRNKNGKILLKGLEDKRFGYWSSRQNLMAPFDREFVISLGVSVGGMADFPNNVMKPWINEDPKAETMFYNAEKHWKKTWVGDLYSLKVDYVRVYSV